MGESTVSAPVAWLTGTVVVVVVDEVLVVEVLVVEVLVGGRAVVAVALGPLDPQAACHQRQERDQPQARKHGPRPALRSTGFFFSWQNVDPPDASAAHRGLTGTGRSTH